MVYSAKYDAASPSRYYKEAEVPPVLWRLLHEFLSVKFGEGESRVHRLQELVRHDRMELASKEATGVSSTVGALMGQKAQSEARMRDADASVHTL